MCDPLNLNAISDNVNASYSTIIYALYDKVVLFFFHVNSRNSKLELELAQVRADFERLKSQDNTKTERLEELS